MPIIDFTNQPTITEMLAGSEDQARAMIAQLKLPRKLTIPTHIPKQTAEKLDQYDPKADSLKLKKHLLALQSQTMTMAHSAKAIKKIVELCDSQKPEVARRAAMTILKLSHLDEPPDLYPLDEDFFFDDEEDQTPKKKRQKSPAATAAAVQTAPPATTPPEPPTTPNILNSPLTHSEFPTFTLTTTPPPPRTIQSLYPLAHFLILIFILILIPKHPTQSAPVSSFAFHVSRFPQPTPAICYNTGLVSPEPQMPTQTPELLSPAGDWDSLRAAVANGADAVYFGLDQFNARHRATNFTLAELPEVMAYLHAHNVKGFLTFNTLVFSDELESASDYIKAVAIAGVDAVIVQDLGITQLIHTLAPSLHIHGSTQMTLTEPEGIKFVQNLGVQRVVLARELGLKEIQKIATALSPKEESPGIRSLGPTPQLEVFIHGALCVAYSGQCLTSESLGGRSANRGQCAQACRLPYQLLVDGTPKDLGDKAYLLSPSDLAAHDLIADLTDLGISCFKIEGRLKSAHYVAATTQTYLAAIDAKLANQNFQISDQQRHDLEQTFSRGFTHGFLSGVNHQQLVAAKFPKARGTKIGTVLSKTNRAITVQPLVPRPSGSAQLPLKPGDGILFDEGHPEQDEQGGRIYSVRRLDKHRLELEFHPNDVNLAYINPGALVWKTDDPALKRRLEHSYSRDTITHRTPLHFTLHANVGSHLQLAGEAEGRTAAATWTEKPLERANKFPLTEQTAKDQLSRLGETPYDLATLTLHTDNQTMVPKSILNDLRRQVIDQLLTQRTRTHKIETPNALDQLRAALPPRTTNHEPRTTNLHVLIRTMPQLDALLANKHSINPSTVYADFEDVRRYPEAIAKCREHHIPIALATLRIVKPGEEGFLKQVSDCNPDALLVRHLGAIHYYQSRSPEIPLIGDFALNIANELTAKIFADAGLIRMVPSYDLNWTQLTALLRRFDPSRFECVIHQHMPMFHMEHCVFAHTLSNGKDFHDCGRPCEKHKVDLTDRIGEPHPLIPDVGCRNTLFNAKAQTAAEYIPDMQKLGIRHFRVELLRESPDDAIKLLTHYAAALAGQAAPLQTLRSLRVLNQLGVTRGTLAHE